MNERTGGAVLIDALKANGVDLAFCVPGESYLEALDAFYDARDAIRLIVCRQEGGAAYMAEAFGKLTGRPGICFVTRGPGATNASIGIHTARQDSTPMILFVGQVETTMKGREAFQEVEIAATFGTLAKWASDIDDASRIPEYVARAFHVATSGRPGPVVLGLPEDVLAARVRVGDVAAASPARSVPPTDALERMRALVAQSARPLAILGGSGWTVAARREIAAWLEAASIPTACGFRRQDLIDNESPVYVGHAGVGIMPYLAKRIVEADLVLAIGSRLGEAVTQGFTLIEAPRPKQRLIHVYPDPDELGRVYQPDLPINAAIPEFAAALRSLAPPEPRWRAWSSALREEYEGSRDVARREARAREGYVDLANVVAHLAQTLPNDAIVTTGAGNFAGWVHRYFRYRNYPAQLGAVNGSMGYGLPSALAAKLVHPKRLVVAFCGDGDFLMTGQELATAMQYHVPVVVVLANNGMYGTIRMHQEREHPERVVGTELTNPDFVRLAEAYGAHAERVATDDEFPAAFERARASGRLAVLELAVDPELLSTRATVGSLRERAKTRS
ncbi:MAG: thiamine pyrophosphate-binding protein [Candidatus Eremiobacteraeota bacterium]|nr:thiamine pyrophosphate-binding protein [Candidatus Eremiobacteraeota bacterium]